MLEVSVQVLQTSIGVQILEVSGHDGTSSKMVRLRKEQVESSEWQRLRSPQTQQRKNEESEATLSTPH
jgi:hypothetical protein